jgi:serine/threonine protein kinase
MFIDFMPAGDLMGVLNKFEQVPVEIARFYSAQIVLSLEYLHNKNLIYRDLKPENVLVDTNGYLKLADFGFIKQLNNYEKTYTFCGTPEYLAPEIIKNMGYSHSVDWYALGIFIYELLYGIPPFMANDPMEIFEMVLKKKMLFPKIFDKDAKSLIKKLCHHDLTSRFGNLVGGVNDIKKHRFFETIDWVSLYQMKINPIHIPDIKKVDATTKIKVMTTQTLEEQNDNVKFPPIKGEKDPFLNWF